MKRFLLLASLALLSLAVAVAWRSRPGESARVMPMVAAEPAGTAAEPAKPVAVSDPADAQAAAMPATTAAPLTSGLFGDRGPVRIEHVPLGRFRDQLLQLSASARDAALKQLGDLKVPVNDVAALHVDRNGRLFYECEPPASDHFDEEAAADWREAAADAGAFPGAVPIASPPVFHSKAGAPNVIYLDFNGDIIKGTAWNSSVASYTAKPFDTDGDPKTFSTSEQSAIRDIFLRVAEDFRPFNVNVTTEEPAAFGPHIGRVLITESVDANGVSLPAPTAGGVAYLAVFGDPNYSYYSPALVYANNLSRDAAHIAEAASHEMGHNLALSHDGTATDSYYRGHGGYGETSWAPIMGASYYSNLTQWCKGEYYGANNPEDDIAIIAGYLGFGADDHSDDATTPANLLFGDAVLSGLGIVGAGGDRDRFSFTLSADRVVSLVATPYRSGSWWGSGGGNLHVKLELLDSHSAVIPLPSPGSNSTSASVSVALSAGTYQLRLSGTGTGNPLSASPTGYTAYGSMGQYTLTGSVTEPVLPVVRNDTGPQVVTVGKQVYFYVSAEGSPTPTYRWQRLPADAAEWLDLTDDATYTGTASNTLRITSTTLGMSGDRFRCQVSNAAGTVISAASQLTVQAAVAPVVYGLPSLLTVPYGEQMSLHASVTGSDPLTYQWKKDGVAIEAANWQSLYVWSAVTSDSGNYTLTVANSVGTVTSSPVAVTIAAPIAPSIGAMRPSLVVPLNETLSIQATVKGSQPMTFQWRKNGSPITGATNTGYYQARATEGDAGTYDLVATNVAGSATSDGVVVTIAPAEPPSIFGLPPSLTTDAGSGLSFSPSVTGTSPMTFQWSKDGAAISGATSSYFWKHNLTTTDSGSYVLTATNSAGTTTSAPIAVIVQAATAPVIFGLPPSVTVAYGTSLSLYGQLTGTQPITLQWKRNGASISSATSSSYYRSSATTDDNGEYTLTATNAVGSVTSLPVLVTVQPAIPPVVWGLPPSITRDYGTSLYLSPNLAGTGPMTLQWKRNGQAIAGATNQSLSLDRVTTADAGEYTLTATNVAGSTTSAGVAVTVNAAIPPVLYGLPSAKTFAAGDPLHLSASYTGTLPMTFLWKKDGVALTNGTSSSYSRNSSATGDSGVYTLTATNVAGTTTTAGVTVTVAAPVAPTIFGLPPSVTVTPGSSFYLYPTILGTNPMTFKWHRDGVFIEGATSGDYSQWTATSSDSGVYTLVATNSVGSVTSSPVAVTVAAPVRPVIYELPPTLTVPAGETLQLNASVTGTLPITYQWKKDGVAITGSTSPYWTKSNAAAADSGSYTLTATNAAGTTTSSPVAVVVSPPVAPFIYGLPTSIQRTTKESLSLYPNVTGTQPITYQWRRNGAPINEATSRSYWKSTLTAEDSGDYTLEATNSVGTFVSPTVSVTVKLAIAPQIETQPVSRTVTIGAAASLSVAASGYPTPSYQWRKNGASLYDSDTVSGVYSAVLLLKNCQVEDAGNYDVVVSNSVASVTSSVAVVTVSKSPVNRPPEASFSLSRERTIGQTLTITINVGDPDGNFSYANFWVRTPGRGWLALQTDNSTIPTSDLSAAHAVATSAGLHTRTFEFTPDDGPGEYQFALTSVDQQALTTEAPKRTIVVTSRPLLTGDFDGDGAADLFLQNLETGERQVWLMREGKVAAVAALPTVNVRWEVAAKADLNRDGWLDLVWQNTESGERSIWFMAGSRYHGNAGSLPTVSSDWRIAGAADFNGDSHPDLVWQNLQTGERSIWIMQEAGHSGTSVSLSTVSTDWMIVGVGDLNGDGQADLLWRHMVSGALAAWLMDGPVFASGVNIATVSVDWDVAELADYNDDGQLDIVWQHRGTGELSIWMMDGTSYHGSAVAVPTPTPGLSAGTSYRRTSAVSPAHVDFTGDRKADVILQNLTTGARSVLSLDGVTAGATTPLPVVSAEWQIAATADMDGDGMPDLIWQNHVTGNRSIWLMNRTSYPGIPVALPQVPPEWKIAAAADFNGDRKPDLLWQNHVTGQRAIWYMDGTTYTGNAVDLPWVPLDWLMVAAGDLSGDSKTDIVWRNVTTGALTVWVMNGDTFSYSFSIATVAVDWQVAQLSDFTGDGKLDLLWQHRSTGELSIWALNYLTYSSLAFTLPPAPEGWTAGPAVR
jgi:hypothetical protein